MKFDHEVIEGVAELVRAEHTDPRLFPRVSEAIYWWPEHEGAEWPSRVFFVADDWGDPLDRDPWAYFEDALGGDTKARLRWIDLPGFEYELVHAEVDETASRRVPRDGAASDRRS